LISLQIEAAHEDGRGPQRKSALIELDAMLALIRPALALAVPRNPDV
jgi:hypothetical protein